jgi:glycosyltransferase involved in cell wall biosynthesis
MNLLFNASNTHSEEGIVLIQHLLEGFLAYSDTLKIRLYLSREHKERIQAFIQSLGQIGQRIHLVLFQPRGKIQRFFWEQVILPDIIRRKRIDVLFSFGNTGPCFPGCKQILYLQESAPFSHYQPETQRIRWWLHQRMQSWLTGLAQQGSQRVIVPGQWLIKPMRRAILKRKPKNAYHVTRPGIPHFKTATPHQSFAPHEVDLLESLERWRASDEKIMLYPCNLAPQKNIPYLLDAIRCLQQQDMPPFRLLLTFDENTPEHFSCKPDILEAVTRCNTERIRLTGSLCRDAMSHVYRMTDIMVFPSLVEASGLPLVEAMSYGIPVVAVQSESPSATEAAFARDICEDGALYANPKSPASFAKVLATLLQDPVLAFEIGQKGKQRTESFSWPRHITQILKE